MKDPEIIVAEDPQVGSVNNEPTVPDITLNIPDTGYPPEPPIEPYLSEPPAIHLDIVGYPTYDQTNYVATGSKPESQPDMGDIEGWSGEKDYEYSVNETEFSDKIDQQRKIYFGHEKEEPHMVTDEQKAPELHIHLELDSSVDEFDFRETAEEWKEALSDSPRFEGYTGSSSFVGNMRYDRDTRGLTMKLNGKSYNFCDVPERKWSDLKGATSIGKAFNDIVKGQHDCSISLNIPEENIVRNPIREAIGQIRNEFEWLSDEYLDRIKRVNAKGKWYLIRAAAETVTDHRSEGEQYRRKLDGDELHAIARTAISHAMDINHLGPDYKTKSLIADAEYDKKRKEIQMLVHEEDPEVNQAIADHKITAVSINGGSPRSTEVKCESTECFNVPRGVVLGEMDGIALTWVVTNRDGVYWQGERIPSAKPGVSNTKIEILN